MANVKYMGHLFMVNEDGTTEKRTLSGMKAQTRDEAEARARRWADEVAGGRDHMIAVHPPGEAFVLIRATKSTAEEDAG